MKRVIDLVKELFGHHGYVLEDEHGTDVLVLGRNDVRVGLSIRQGFTHRKDIESFKASMKGSGLGRGMFIALGGHSVRASELATGSDIVLWDRERFETELGKAVLSGAEGEGGSEVFEKAIGIMDQVPDFSVETLEGEEVRVGHGDIAVVDVAVLPGDPSTNLATISEDGMLIGARVDKATASRAAASSVKNIFSIEPRLVPFMIFGYSCVIDVEGIERIDRKGMVAVDGINGEPGRWRFPEEGDPTTGFMDQERPAPELREDECADRAKEFAAGINTITVNVKDDKEHVTVYEKRKVSPRMDAVRVELLGIVHVPFWKVVGTNGSIMVNAVTGRMRVDGVGK